jgi:hypothetical protein
MSVLNKIRIKKIESLLIIISIIIIFFAAYKLAAIAKLQDFSIYWMAAHTWLGGKNPYDLIWHHEYVTGEVGLIDSTKNTLKVWSPPYFLVPMILFGIWDLFTAKIFFITILLAQAFILAYRVINSIIISNRISNPVLLFPKIIVYLSALPIWLWASAFFCGGMGILSALAPLFMTFVRGYGAIWHWAVFWLLLSLKPHIAFFGSLFILCALPKDARIRSLKGFGIACVVIMSVLTIYSPQVFSQYLSLDASIVNEYIVSTSTLNRLIRFLGCPPEVYYALAGGFLVVFFCLLKRPPRLHSLSEIIAFSILVNQILLFASPYAWTHDYQVSAGWLWATFTLGITSGPLAWLNLVSMISFNFLNLFGLEHLAMVLWWYLSIVNFVKIYKTKTS